MALFLFPFNIASGGAAGIAILFEVWFDLSHAYTIWGLNIILLLFAVRWIGVLSSLKTVYTVSFTSLTIFVLQSFSIGLDMLPPIYVSFLLGAVVFGIGVGILFRNGASSGGLAIIAHIFFVLFKWLPGKSMFWMNMVVFSLIAYVIDWTLIFGAVLVQWIATKVINYVVSYQVQRDEDDTAMSA
ncbi:membrane protein [Halalkalibacter akibai JCM 9157]|uniref:Membrane protein n=2 Tax=Halalkalibacter akibai TaxID=1411 RepID=W4QX18_HALA3|nr:membrane protein [Halalkalibacter akibai JCM 9157]